MTGSSLAVQAELDRHRTLPHAAHVLARLDRRLTGPLDDPPPAFTWRDGPITGTS